MQKRSVKVYCEIPNLFYFNNADDTAWDWILKYSWDTTPISNVLVSIQTRSSPEDINNDNNYDDRENLFKKIRNNFLNFDKTKFK